MRSGMKVAVVGGVFAVVAGGVGYAGWNLVGSVADGGDGGLSTRSAPRKTGPPDAAETEEAAGRFLTAWASGEGSAAARLTNDPVAAEAVLAGYSASAHVTRAEITPGPATGATVPFTVSATVEYEGTSETWEYASRLTVVRGLSTGRAVVDWDPSVVHPELTEGTSLSTSESTAPPIRAVDRDGVELTAEKFPSLAGILDELREKYGAEAGGTAGVELVLASDDGSVPDRTLLTLAEGEPGTVPTYLDAGVQAAAEQAVSRYGKASVVAVEPSTGHIRAVANSPAAGFNTALQGGQAPGSTMKIVTAAMMLDRGLVNGADSPVECPPTVVWERTFQNLDKFEVPGATLRTAFARSCNTTFIKPVKPLGAAAGSALGETAAQYFGIGKDWQSGVVTRDGSVPASTGSETAASYIGQGRVQMNALNMASIAATVKDGGFRQPVIVPASLDDRPLAVAQRMPGGMAETLRGLMRAGAAPGGTGAEAMAAVGGDKGAKTGSAEVDGQGQSNSWFTAFADDLAAAAVVSAGGHGGDAAGPVVAAVLGAR
ncbi:penicillin-binding transpeptidase domain-containing protein [Streptomyces sp. C10-9-1]|uniref:penicillin-binding transpeptidase domain-containing protein n=1 Tax=Streptomyces sp. C10-9-1 TaxID=1859285 RepID=UPI0021127FA4|nr:penicillin-binding transpeptidase domain-containing protein [Streptomyces sp. C10-9-1]MCQ6555656.1 penicillin-binding transpeptidase domain-containing protein [Streptomyces sp. C10-9-1]